MAMTFEAILDRFSLVRGADVASSELRTRGESPYRIRAMANEDIFLFAKTIDNAQVIRQAAPQEGKTCWRTIAGSMAGAIALVLVMLPGLYGTVAGYRVEALRVEKARLLSQRSELELAEAKTLSQEHLQELAAKQHFVDPGPDKIVFLENHRDSIVAKRAAPPLKAQVQAQAQAQDQDQDR